MPSSQTTSTLRNHRDLRRVLERAEAGDVLVIDHRDLDAASARALLDRKPLAVVNAADFISGRFANLGPALLADAGVALIEGDPAAVRALKDGTAVRLDGGRLYAGDAVLLDGRLLTSADVRERMDRARSGLASQLDTFAHTASEFVRREESLLLHGQGLPELRTDLSGRVVVVVGPTATKADLRPLRTFLREQRPVVIAVGAGADLVRRRRRRAHLLVLDGDGLPGDRTLERADEVVLHGAADAVRRKVDKLNVPTHVVSSGASSMDIALLLARAGGARLVVPVGDPATLEELIDRDRSDQASTVLTRLRLGSSVVDASSVPLLYTGRVRLWHLALVLLAALAVLALVLTATPIGNDWWHDLQDRLPEWLGGDR